MGEITITVVTEFELQWEDKGSGGKMNGSFWRPKATEGYYILGGYAQRGYVAAPDGAVIAVKAPFGPIQHPMAYERIWTDEGSGAHTEGSFWRPIPPEGYVALGIFCQKGYLEPEIEAMVCVHENLVIKGRALEKELVWNDKGTTILGLEN